MSLPVLKDLLRRAHLNNLIVETQAYLHKTWFTPRWRIALDDTRLNDHNGHLLIPKRALYFALDFVLKNTLVAISNAYKYFRASGSVIPLR